MLVKPLQYRIFYISLLCSVFFIALIVRIFVLSHLHHEYNLSALSAEHGVLALSLMRGEGFAYHGSFEDRQWNEKRLIDPIEYKDSLKKSDIYYSAHEVPGYAVLLAATWKLFGEERYIYLQVIQIVLDSLLVFLMYWLSVRIFRERVVALIAAFLFAICLPEARLATVALRDVWPTFFLISIVSLLIKSFDYQSIKIRSAFYLCIGVLFGISALIHPVLQFFPFFLTGALLMIRGRKEALVFCMCSIAMMGLVVAPWAIRNYIHFQKIILTRDVMWQGIWEGWGAIPDNPIGAQHSDAALCELMNLKFPLEPCFTPKSNEIPKEIVLEAIKKYPLWILFTPFRSVQYLLSPSYNWNLPPFAVEHTSVSIRMAVSQGFERSFATYKENGKKKLLIETILKYPNDVFLIVVDKTTHSILGVNPFLKKVSSNLLPAMIIVTILTALTMIGSFGIFLLAFVGFLLRRRYWKSDILILSIPVYFHLLLLPIGAEPRYILPIFFVYFLFASYALIYLPPRIKKFIFCRRMNST